MIISHSRQFIFLKSTKVAGSTVQLILALACRDGDIITPGEKPLSVRESLNVRSWNCHVPFTWAPRLIAESVLSGKGRPQFGQHDTAKRVYKLMPSKLWNRYVKIVVMRNPFDRIVSWYFWDTKGGAATGRSFEDYVFDKQKIITSYRRQTHIDGKEIADVYLRFEDLENDLNQLKGLLDIEALQPELVRSLRLKKQQSTGGCDYSGNVCKLPRGSGSHSQTVCSRN